MPTHRVTLADVARRAGVSRATASYVLNGRDREMRISESSRDRVLRATSELEYRPNLIARGFRAQVTRTIALVSDTIATQQYAGRMVYGALSAAVEAQHLLFVGETEGDANVEERLVRDLLDRRVDGFVYATMYTREVVLPTALHRQPVVLLNCLARGLSLPAVLPDEVGAGRTAAGALLAAGHRDGIYLVGEDAEHVIAARERRRGIDEVLGGAGVTLAGRVSCAWWPEAAFDAVGAFLDSGARPRTLICWNDRVAFGAYQAVRAAGLRIPADVSVISFDDSELACWLRPQLTSIALPHYEMGRRAVQLLLSGDAPPLADRLQMPLRNRVSVADLTQGAPDG